MRKFWKNYWLILAMAALKLAIQLLAPSHAYDLQRDEYLYLAEGHHLAWGFLEVPPTMALLAALCRLLGESMFIVRLIPGLIGAGTLFLTGKIVLELGGNRFAQLAATLAFLVSAYLRVDMLFQPNALEVFYFTWCAYFLVRYIHRPDRRCILYFGIVLGLGLMNKYSMGLLAAGVLVGMLMTPHRRLFRDKIFYIGMAIALVIFLPNLIWQAVHHFPVTKHMTELSAYQLVYVSPVSFLIGQLELNLPGLVVWLAGLWFFLVSTQGKPYRLLGWIYITVVVVLIVLHGKVYYSIGCYPMLMAGGGVYLSRQNTPRVRFIRRPILITSMVLLGIWMLPMMIPIYAPERMAKFCLPLRSSGLTRWEDNTIHPLPQDYADMLGWKQMGMAAVNTYLSLDPATKSHTIIFGDNYGLCGAVAYYGRNSDLPEVLGKEASFLLWTPTHVTLDNVLLLTDDSTDIHKPILTENFRSIRLVSRVTDPLSRQFGDAVLMCYGASPLLGAWFNARTRRLEAFFR